jgi:hypothetical protein
LGEKWKKNRKFEKKRKRKKHLELNPTTRKGATHVS